MDNMILNNCLDQVGRQLTNVAGLHVLDFEADDIQIPACMLSLPYDIDYHGTYSHGMMSFRIAITALFGLAEDRLRRAHILQYGDGFGNPKSIPSILESGSYNAFDDITVETGNHQVVRIAGQELISGIYVAKITGSGTG